LQVDFLQNGTCGLYDWNYEMARSAEQSPVRSWTCRRIAMRRTILAMVALPLFVAVPMFAQNGGGVRSGHQPNVANMVQRQVNHLTTLLDLTPGQQTQLTSLLTNNFNTNQPLRQSEFKAERALRTAENNNNSTGIQAAHQQLATIDGQIAANRAAFNTALAGVLTPDQMTKYKALGPGAGAAGRGFRRGWSGGPGGSGATGSQ
jgi:LTXXQ motif family protein